MSTIMGYWYDGTSSRRQPAVAHVAGGTFSLRVEGREVVAPTPLPRLRIASRLGNTPRAIHLPGGAKFETDDNDAVDALVPPRARLLHHLESKLRYVALGVVVVAAVVWGTLRFGVPAAAEAVAFALPAQASASIGAGVLQLLDSQLLEPSRLSEAEQARLRLRFEELLGERPPGRVLFRDAGESIGANALALPDGTIVFTDQLVALAEHDEELAAILAHETGHVVRRHSLRQAIQASGLAVMVVAVFGDVSSLSSLVTAIPVVLTELGYSRDFEREADAYAAARLRENGIAPAHFGNMLARLERSHCDGPCDGGEGLGAYLSTHPPTAERIRAMATAAGH